VGFTPQVVDLDGDGIPDILSGSYPGELYFFKGRANGTFASADVLTDAAGKVIRLGRASTVHACDWRGSGLPDLLVGNVEGEAYLVPNVGTKAKPAFGQAQKLQADGKPIQAPGGDSHPIMADWEQRGRPGLVLGSGDGSVRWYPNGGTRTDPVLGKGQVLVGPGSPGEEDEVPSRSGVRAKICVTDWNGDGRLDLLLGDVCSCKARPSRMTPADARALDEVEQTYRRVVARWERRINDQEQKIASERGDGMRKRQLEEELERMRMEYRKELEGPSRILLQYQPQDLITGRVWYFERTSGRPTTK
jgi:hypothetical protein